jgi:hypothetical protein
MKTWTFVTAVFWLFYNMSVCPQSEEQTCTRQNLTDPQTTITQVLSQTWYFPNCTRPPPVGAQTRTI